MITEIPFVVRPGVLCLHFARRNRPRLKSLGGSVDQDSGQFLDTIPTFPRRELAGLMVPETARNRSSVS
jgi:hypothetical protein